MCNAWASVLTAINSTPLTPASTILFTALLAAAADTDDLNVCILFYIHIEIICHAGTSSLAKQIPHQRFDFVAPSRTLTPGLRF